MSKHSLISPMTIADHLLTDSEVLITEIYSCFNPFEPPQDEFYVDCEAVRGDWNIERELGRKITRSKQPTYQLYTGHRGVGKSTELGHLQAYLDIQKFKVVYFAADEDDIEIEDTQYADILFACTRHLVQQVPLASGHNPLIDWMAKQRDLLQDVAQVNMAISDVTLETPDIMMFPKISAMFKAEPDKRREIRRRINDRTESLLGALNEFIKAAEISLEKKGYRGLVVIVDNLDRMSEIREEDAAASNYDEIYLDRASKLRGLKCHMIYTTPIAMIYSARRPRLEDRYDGLDMLPLVVVRQPDKTINPVGLSKLKEIVAQRVRFVHPKLLQTLEGEVTGVPIPGIFDSSDSLERLCLMSGGHVRNLMQLVQKAIDWTDILPITREAVNRAIADMRETYLTTIQDNQWRLLAEAYEKKDYKRDREHLSLFLNRCLLEYRCYDRDNTITWCDVHPLIEEIPQFKAALAALEASKSPQ